MILSVPFCPYHFVPYHFVLEPHDAITDKNIPLHQQPTTSLYSVFDFNESTDENRIAVSLGHRPTEIAAVANLPQNSFRI